MEGTKVIICCKRQRKRGNVLCSDYFNVFGALTHTLLEEKEKGGSEAGERGANLKPFVTGHQTYDMIVVLLNFYSTCCLDWILLLFRYAQFGINTKRQRVVENLSILSFETFVV